MPLVCSPISAEEWWISGRGGRMEEGQKRLRVLRLTGTRLIASRHSLPRVCAGDGQKYGLRSAAVWRSACRNKVYSCLQKKTYQSYEALPA